MAISHSILRQYSDTSTTRIQLSETVSGATERNIDIALGIGTDTSIPFTVDRAKLLALCIYSDAALTLETNSSSAAVDTIVLVAGQARIWTLATDGLALCPFTASVTALFATNVAAASFKLRALLSQ